ncbi:phytoene dehydrogenase-like protein [Friedmanniella endophytica]|uniref:Phytoene dehydrogenase-like protein n=1 Tax=Microlunatus kandeliicorticis TaxID=1759536 RepID=A0A7W3P7J0_9ACTN|nr:NAD(P)/FAD-dependent oxidoreductase [Microlunatus kandeliicorticis]MBA8796002.1 phytoene dehydrogenase-like protein [Microlunatus kandeliicorticis]
MGPSRDDADRAESTGQAAGLRVAVVGAGLAGLVCARHLTRAGAEVTVFERADRVGGRVTTDVVDGYRCDRGFQLINPAYPAVPRELDVPALDLRAFAAGVFVAHGSQGYRLADPRRLPSAVGDTVLAPVGTLTEKMAFACWAMRALLPVPKLLAGDDRTLAEALDQAGVRGLLRTGVVDQFLAGVLGEHDQRTSATFALLLVRSFLLGEPSVPSLGMRRVPEQLAAGLPDGALRLGVEVHEVAPGRVRTADGEHRVDAVVVATDPVTAERLTDVDAPPMRALTTYWHSTDEPPAPAAEARLLHLDADHRGPLVNSAVMTAVAPSYAPAGRHLVASTVVGDGTGADSAEPVVRRQLGLLYRGADVAGWELVHTHRITEALPAQEAPLRVRKPVRLDHGLYVAGDHRDTASIQGALVSGRRAAHAVLAAHR